MYTVYTYKSMVLAILTHLLSSGNESYISTDTEAIEGLPFGSLQVSRVYR
jgi:hypothetical protein